MCDLKNVLSEFEITSPEMFWFRSTLLPLRQYVNDVFYVVGMFDRHGETMTNKIPAVTLLLVSCLVGVALSDGFSNAASSLAAMDGSNETTSCVGAVPQECAKCEGKCKAWIDKCKDGGQYACYKAVACLCKCNLDAGGCGSSKKALEECYQKNEKLAKELGPPNNELALRP